MTRLVVKLIEATVRARKVLAQILYIPVKMINRSRRAMAILNLDQPVDDVLAEAIGAGEGIVRVRRATLQ